MSITHHRRDAGQTLAEVGIVLPLLFILIFGVVELGWAIFQNNVIRGYVREGSNLISRNVTLEEAENAIVSASTSGGPVRIDADSGESRLILSVVTIASSGANDGDPIIVQRRIVGALEETSVLGDPPASAFGGPPDYKALDPEDNAGLVATLPDGYTLAPGHSLYVTEIFTSRGRIIDSWALPNVLYASAFF
jgi:hypothetical protein